jgi:polysaccharide biosynthesis transport protein
MMESGNYPQPMSPMPQATNGASKRTPWASMHPSQVQSKNNDAIDLGEIFSALRRRSWVVVGVAGVVTSLAMVKANSNPAYRGSFQILAKSSSPETQVTASLPQALNPTLSRDTSTAGAQPGFDETKLKVLKSPKVLQPVVERLKGQYEDMTYDRLAASIEIKPVPNTEVLEVRYEDKDRNRVKTVLKELVESYQLYSLEEKLADVRQGTTFIEAQLPRLQKEVEDGQSRLQRLRQDYSLFDPESQNREISDQINTFKKQRLDNQIAMKQALTLQNALKGQIAQSSDGIAAGSALSQSASYQKLRDQLTTIEARLADESSMFLPDSPNVKILEEQKAKIVAALQDEASRVELEADTQISGLQAREIALARTEEQLNQRLKELSVAAREYTDTQRKLQISTDTLNQFLAKQAALKIEEGQKQTPWQLLSAPTDPQVAWFRETLMIGALLGILSGAAIALLLDKLSNVFHSSDDVKQIAKQPMLGVIPHNQDLEEMNRLSRTPTSMAGLQQVIYTFKPRRFGAVPFVEAMRSLFTNISLLRPDRPIRSLVISSPTPQDGKSTTALYLAQVAAAMGKRVLLVDAELRRPQMHIRLGLDNTQGLSDVLASDIPAEEAIQRSKIEQNLFVLTAGQTLRDPAGLLASPKMLQLMDQFKEDYDFVVYDTPPLVGFSDATIVAVKTDGMVMVTRVGKTDRSIVDRALDSLRFSPSLLLGVVANDCKHQTNTVYKSYYSIAPQQSLQESLPTLR